MGMSQRCLFCLTEKNYMVLVPDIGKDGDVICALYGVSYFYVLSLVSGSEDLMKVVGPAYVHGLMDGQVLQLRDQGVLKERLFTLI
jgi:hypothetical protein